MGEKHGGKGQIRCDSQRTCGDEKQGSERGERENIGRIQ